MSTALQPAASLLPDGSPLTGVPPPAPPPPRERNPASPAAIREIARKLFAQADPTLPASHITATTRILPHVYTRGVHGPLEKRLYHAILGGERLFLHGAALGVGMSVFVADYARAFNLECQLRGDPRRIAYLRIEKSTTTVRRFLEALCNAVESPLTDSEARLSSPLGLGKRIIAQAQRRRICAFIIDHVHHASDAIRSAIADLMMATDPRYAVPLEIDEYASVRPRTAIMLADHQRPELLFQNQPEVLTLLQGACATLLPYRMVEEVADVLRQADLGLEDLDLDDPEDREIARLVLEASDGLISSMAGLLGLVDLYATVHGGYRPDLALVQAALAHHRRMVRLLRGRNTAEGDAYRTVAASSPRSGTKSRSDAKCGRADPTLAEGSDAKRPRASERGAGRPKRAAALKEKRAARKIAEAEGQDMRRKGFAVLPERRS